MSAAVELMLAECHSKCPGLGRDSVLGGRQGDALCLGGDQRSQLFYPEGNGNISPRSPCPTSKRRRLEAAVGRGGACWRPGFSSGGPGHSPSPAAELVRVRSRRKL